MFRGVVVLAWLVLACRSFAAESPKVVLFTGADPIQPAALVQLEAIRKQLDASPLQGAEVFLETLDGFRFGSENLTPEFLALMKKKYAHQHVDLVIGLGNYAADFSIKNHAEVWPGAPVLLSSVPEDWLSQRSLPDGFSTVPYRIDVAKTLSIAQALQPEAHRLVVVGGNADVDLRFVKRVVEAAEKNKAQWSVIEEWTGLPLNELQRRLALLDRNWAVVYTTMYRDRDGRRYFPYQAVAPMVEASHVPIYGWYSVYLKYGLTAGAVYDMEENGRKTGEVASSVLRGGHVEVSALPALPERCVANLSEFDRLGLSVSRLPSACRLVNPPPSVFREYRGTVVTLLGVLLAQSVTIAALLTQRRQRRRAEAEAGERRNDLARAARLATVGELSASIAHEVGQPLGAILSNADAADLLLTSSPANAEEVHEILADVRRDALRANEVVVRLRALLAKQSVSFSAMNLDETLTQSLPLIEPEARRRCITVKMLLNAGNVKIFGDRVQIQQILLNLALNSMDAMQHTAPDERVLSISTRLLDSGIELVVADRGHGLPAGAATRLFEPFFTTKAHGMGLGLSIVRAIAEAHHGRVNAAERNGGGTVISLTLPLWNGLREAGIEGGSRTAMDRTVNSTGRAAKS
ncbi:ATP-binding protein [Caballeronia sp. S22]|uniref:sensor histidine kinase n=1 Tax=Caballeronia sp. S22 TaxID=3137182 RepID=UPI0035312A48